MLKKEIPALLMHWSDRNNEDFDEELVRARMHYGDETDSGL
jgi:hypothetical protein